MKVLKIILLILISLSSNINIQGQENTSVLERTPEQEAAKQTEKIQKELNLNTAQAKQIHEINLKYARERQISNSRTEALERIKNKEADYKGILKPEQYNQFKSKKYENSTDISPNLKRTNPATTNSYRQTNPTPTYRTGRPLLEQNKGRDSNTRQTEGNNQSLRTNPVENNRNTYNRSNSERTGTTNIQTERNSSSTSSERNTSTQSNNSSTIRERNTNTQSNNNSTTNSRSTNTSGSSYNGGSRNTENSRNSSGSTNSSRSSSNSNTNRR